ncbi:MAG: ABC transporter permease [Planctomycetota bacterium]
MKRPALRWGMPLLARELVEMAAQRRTYVLRTVYALLLFVAFLFYLDQTVYAARDPMSVLGRGKELFDFLIAAQAWGIYLFLPAMMSGVIALEKERSTLALLLITDMRPWEILLQKYLSRLITMFSYLLLSMPLMAIAFAIGGISTDNLLSGVYVLALTCLQVGAFSLLCSTWFAGANASLIASYLGGFVVFFLYSFIVEVLWNVFRLWIFRYDEWGFLPLTLYNSLGDDLRKTVMHSIPIGISVVLFLVLARVVFYKRALLAPKGWMLLFFKCLDRIYNWLNRFAGGVVLVGEKNSLPVDEPIAWLETEKQALGQFRYLFRVEIVLMLPVIFVLLEYYVSNDISDRLAFSKAMVMFLWCVAALVFAILSANMIPQERMRETLPALLATPLSGREILLQKMKGLRRLMFVFWAPFFVLFLLEAWGRVGFKRINSYLYGFQDAPPLLQVIESIPVRYLLVSVLTVVLYLPLVSWVGMWLGMKCRNRMRAVFLALSILTAWCMLPYAVAFLLSGIFYPFAPPLLESSANLLFFSPAATIMVNEAFPRDVREINPVLFFTLSFLSQGGVLWLVRRECLRKADRYLGRIPEPDDLPPSETNEERIKIF